MPGNPAAQVGADVGKHPPLIFILPQYECAIAVYCLLPAVDPGTSEIEQSGHADWITIQRSKRYPGVILRFGRCWRDQVANRRDSKDSCHQRAEKHCYSFDEVTAAYDVHGGFWNHACSLFYIINQHRAGCHPPGGVRGNEQNCLLVSISAYTRTRKTALLNTIGCLYNRDITPPSEQAPILPPAG